MQASRQNNVGGRTTWESDLEKQRGNFDLEIGGDPCCMLCCGVWCVWVYIWLVGCAVCGETQKRYMI